MEDDDIYVKFKENCFLRPIADSKSTNEVKKKDDVAPKIDVKSELQELSLSDESQEIIMETMRSIHGSNFSLADPTTYKDCGANIKKSYWQNGGTLMVRSIVNFSKVSNKSCDDEDNPMRRYALRKLESYGFPFAHCVEAFDHCQEDVERALFLLYRRYMGIVRDADAQNEFMETLNQDELLEMREDEKLALESIYETAFEEKEKSTVWSLKFMIEHLLKFSPSENKKSEKIDNNSTTNNVQNKNDNATKRARCRNFERDGKCKFGDRCRFAHVKPEIFDANKIKDAEIALESEKWFFIEVFFPDGSHYPYEAPFICLKTSCHDIPQEVLLRLTRYLYRKAIEMSADGIPCVYSICELLQTDENLYQEISDDKEPFPNINKSLFFEDEVQADVLPNGDIRPLPPTHYELGQTSQNQNFKRNNEEVEKLNKLLIRKFLDIQENIRYRKMLNVRKNLPAFAKMDSILKAIDDSQVLVISGETGCGKSTQVPQFILDNWLLQSSLKNKNDKMTNIEIICTQPRRLSAIGVAERVADERIERIGQTIGYQIRLENKISKQTRLTFCTTGILLRRLTSEPLLESATHIIVDEVHERSAESDFLLMILKDILKCRKDLKVILMSATLNAKLFSDYFGNVPVVDIPGRTFPVEQIFLDDILEKCDFVMEFDSQFCRKFSKKEQDELIQELEYVNTVATADIPPNKTVDEKLDLPAIYARYNECSKTTCKSIFLMDPMRINPDLVESVLKYIVEGENDWPKEGAILIFLPGFQEIQTVYDSLNDSKLFGSRTGKFLLIPLHSSLSSEDQLKVFQPAPKGKRKIVLSTNIAETSITIDDCVFVIDYGLMKEKQFDSNRNMESLDLVWISRANAMQRKGRAGRVMPGVCIHLFTQHRFSYQLLSQPVPEMHRVPLEKLILKTKTLPNYNDKNVIEVLGQTLQPPTEDNIFNAVNRLKDVGALDNEQNLTSLGHHLSTLPVDVRIGKLMLFGAIFQCLDSILTIAACLSSKSPFVSPFNKRTEADKRKREFALRNSDQLTSLMAYKKWLEVSKRSYLASRNFADEHFLSLKTLQTIAEVKYQFLELLVSIGFVPINVPRKRNNYTDNILELTGQQYNANSENNLLLISLLGASLYPNIVKILVPAKTFTQTVAGSFPKLNDPKDLRFKTREDGYVVIHPSSVNADIGNFQASFLIYQEKIKTSRVFIRECSMLPPLPLALFAGSDFKIQLHGGEFMILLENGWIIFKTRNHQIAEMIQCLRNELFKLLEEKIRDPLLDLINNERGRKIIQTIIFVLNNNY